VKKEDEMTTLRIEHAVSDFEVWKAAFDRDPVDRAGSGVRGHRIQRPLDDPAAVAVELDFDSAPAAEAFHDALEEMWRSREAAPALRGPRRVRMVETVETATY
jgi:hypothetical protein